MFKSTLTSLVLFLYALAPAALLSKPAADPAEAVQLSQTCFLHGGDAGPAMDPDG